MVGKLLSFWGGPIFRSYVIFGAGRSLFFKISQNRFVWCDPFIFKDSNSKSQEVLVSAVAFPEKRKCTGVMEARRSQLGWGDLDWNRMRRSCWLRKAVG